MVGTLGAYAFFTWEETKNPSFDKKLPGQTPKRYTVGYIEDEDILEYCQHVAEKQNSDLNIDQFRENEPIIELHCIDSQKGEYLRMSNDELCNYTYKLRNAHYVWTSRKCSDTYYTYFYK